MTAIVEGGMMGRRKAKKLGGREAAGARRWDVGDAGKRRGWEAGRKGNCNRNGGLDGKMVEGRNDETAGPERPMMIRNADMPEPLTTAAEEILFFPNGFLHLYGLSSTLPVIPLASVPFQWSRLSLPDILASRRPASG